MKVLKYSRQREAIKASLMNRCDHPTADALYASIREEFPNISLGTVYRNLNLLHLIHPFPEYPYHRHGRILCIQNGSGAIHRRHSGLLRCRSLIYGSRPSPPADLSSDKRFPG